MSFTAALFRRGGRGCPQVVKSCKYIIIKDLQVNICGAIIGVDSDNLWKEDLRSFAHNFATINPISLN